MSNRPLGILVALLLATVALLLGSYTWFLAPPTHSTSFPGEIPWQEVLLFLSAILLWFAGVTAIYNLGGREKVIYAWTLVFYGAGIAGYFYAVSRV